MAPLTTLVLIALIFAHPTVTQANVAGGGDLGPAVKLVRSADEVTLTNGIVKAVIDTENATVVSLLYQGHELVSKSGRHKTIYFSMSGGRSYETPQHCIYSVTRATANMVDISCDRIYNPLVDKQPWNLDIHFVLRRGNSGLYVYAIVSHPAQFPTASMGEWRMVWSMPQTKTTALLERVYVDNLRHWKMPTPFDFLHSHQMGIKEVVQFTTGQWNGQYDCKYEYSADIGSIPCYGEASDVNNLGAWIVLGSHDYFNDGPVKNDLTAATGLLHLMLYAEHYGGRGFVINHGQSWSKIYGPWFLYLNHKHGGHACWLDAQAQARAERRAQPYNWIANADYPPAGQWGSAQGKFKVEDALQPRVSGAGAWVGLAQPQVAAGNWQYQGSAYQYWARADSSGAFTLPAIRPGKYELYAFTAGAVGEYSHTNINIEPGKRLVLGTLVWHVRHPGKVIAWQIGIPNRTAAEFRHGQDYWVPYLFTKFPSEFTNPLDYYVSKGNWSSAWNYAQTTWMKNGTNKIWKWNIHFSLKSVPRGTSTLTIAFAGAYQGDLNVYVNNTRSPVATVRPADEGGNALLREAVHAKYGVSYVKVPDLDLKAGNNVITLAPTEVHGGFTNFMYDYLDFELP